MVRDTAQAIAWFVQNHLAGFRAQREDLNKERCFVPGDASRNPFIRIDREAREFTRDHSKPN